ARRPCKTADARQRDRRCPGGTDNERKGVRRGAEAEIGRRRRRGRRRARKLPRGERMELPVPWPLPEHEALDVDGDGPVRLLLEEGRVVATRDIRPTVSLAQPVAVDLNP